MASTQVTPTRMELTRTKKKLVTAIKGHKLLKDKRDELMRQFLDLVKVNMELREKVEAGIRSANKNFVIAKAGMDEATLNTALMAPKQEVDLEVGQKNVMSVDIPVFETKTRTADANDDAAAAQGRQSILPRLLRGAGSGRRAFGYRIREDEEKYGMVFPHRMSKQCLEMQNTVGGVGRWCRWTSGYWSST